MKFGSQSPVFWLCREYFNQSLEKNHAQRPHTVCVVFIRHQQAESWSQETQVEASRSEFYIWGLPCQILAKCP